LTIDSSSSIARSKLSDFTSTWVFSAILRSQCALYRRRLKDIFAGALWREFMCPAMR
jgi:hypothetical protein